MRWFDEYGWPGNVRELENVIHREFMLRDEKEICIKPPAGLVRTDFAVATDRVLDGYLQCRVAKSHAMREFDRAYLTRLIQRTRGNVTQAALLAGRERRSLGKLLKRYGIHHRDDTVDGESAS